MGQKARMGGRERLLNERASGLSSNPVVWAGSEKEGVS